MTTLALTASLVACVFLVSACGGDDDAEAPASLDGTSWRLVEGTDITIPDDTEMTIAFEAARTSGSGGCNGSWALRSGGASISWAARVDPDGVRGGGHERRAGLHSRRRCR
jgi:hypothetical protein